MYVCAHTVYITLRGGWPATVHRKHRGVPRGWSKVDFRRSEVGSRESRVRSSLSPNGPARRFVQQHTVYGPGASLRRLSNSGVLEPCSPRSNPRGNVAMSEGTGSSTTPAGELDVSPVWFTEREVAVARLAAALRTRTGIEYHEVAERGPDLVDVLDGPMTRKEAHEYRDRFRRKVIMAGTTLLYAAYGGGLEPEELDEAMEAAVEAATDLQDAEAAALPGVATVRGQERCEHCGADLP